MGRVITGANGTSPDVDLNHIALFAGLSGTIVDGDLVTFDEESATFQAAAVSSTTLGSRTPVFGPKTDIRTETESFSYHSTLSDGNYLFSLGSSNPPALYSKTSKVSPSGELLKTIDITGGNSSSAFEISGGRIIWFIGGNSNLSYRIYDLNLNLLVDTTVITFTGTNYPAVDFLRELPNGKFLIVWADNQSATKAGRHAILNADFSVNTQPTQLLTNGTSVGFEHGLTLSNGKSACVFNTQSTTHHQIVTFSDTGVPTVTAQNTTYSFNASYSYTGVATSATRIKRRILALSSSKIVAMCATAGLSTPRAFIFDVDAGTYTDVGISATVLDVVINGDYVYFIEYRATSGIYISKVYVPSMTFTAGTLVGTWTANSAPSECCGFKNGDRVTLLNKGPGAGLQIIPLSLVNGTISLRTAISVYAGFNASFIADAVISDYGTINIALSQDTDAITPKLVRYNTVTDILSATVTSFPTKSAGNLFLKAKPQGNRIIYITSEEVMYMLGVNIGSTTTDTLQSYLVKPNTSFVVGASVGASSSNKISCMVSTGWRNLNSKYANLFEIISHAQYGGVDARVLSTNVKIL